MEAREEQQQAVKELRKLLQGQDTIMTLAQWTGSTAYVRLFVVKNNQLIDITHRAGEAMGDKTVHSVNKPYGLKYGGYGYGKEFAAVYGLGSALYRKGYKHTLKNCHSNDHSNYSRNDGGNFDASKLPDWHTAGGYRFSQRSI